MKFSFLILAILLPLTVFSYTERVEYYDRDGDQFNEEKQIHFIQNYKIHKTIIEIDRNKDKKPDEITTSYFHHDRMKIYHITQKDTNFDGKWDQKQTKIEKITPFELN